MALLSSVQYRWDFLMQGMMQLLWMALSFMPLYVAFQARAQAARGLLEATEIGGWGFYPTTLVFAFFHLLKAILDGAISPSLVSAIERIRTGTLDFVLLKPADAQFLISTSRFEIWYVVDALAALAIAGWAGFHCRGPGFAPTAFSLPSLAGAALLVVAAVCILYAIWLSVVCAAFYVVRIDNLSYLFTALFDFARWPRGVFRGALHIVFTYALPLLVMTSFPVDALLGRLAARELLWGLLCAGLLVGGSRRIFLRALASYTSASS